LRPRKQAKGCAIKKNEKITAEKERKNPWKRTSPEQRPAQIGRTSVVGPVPHIEGKAQTHPEFERQLKKQYERAPCNRPLLKGVRPESITSATGKSEEYHWGQQGFPNEPASELHSGGGSGERRGDSVKKTDDQNQISMSGATKGSIRGIGKERIKTGLVLILQLRGLSNRKQKRCFSTALTVATYRRSKHHHRRENPQPEGGRKDRVVGRTKQEVDWTT